MFALAASPRGTPGVCPGGSGGFLARSRALHQSAISRAVLLCSFAASTRPRKSGKTSDGLATMLGIVRRSPPAGYRVTAEKHRARIFKGSRHFAELKAVP